MIPVCRPDLNEMDAQAVAAAVKSAFVAGGPAVAEFESAVASYCHRRYGVAVSNGTSALVLAVRALNLPPGSRILIPSFTIVSVLNAVVVNGHVPVFVDVDERTWNIELSSVRRTVLGGVDAAIVVQTYASAPLMRELCELLKEHRVRIIEDAAEGFGGSENDRVFGSFGQMSTLSFYGNKLITTGEGGMVLTDDPDLCERLRFLRNLCFDRGRRYIHTEYSGNYRMSSLQAQLGLSQLERVNTFYKHRRHLYCMYLRLLSDLGPFIQTQFIPEAVKSSYWVFPILLKERAGCKAADFISQLRDHGVDARHFFYPLCQQPCLRSTSVISSELGCNLWQYGLYLPLGNGISQEEVKTSASVVRHLLLMNSIGAVQDESLSGRMF